MNIPSAEPGKTGSTPDPTAVPSARKNITYKLKCPYCGTFFGPINGSSCPHCKRAMTIPALLRADRIRARKHLSPAERRRLSGGGEASPSWGSRINTFFTSRKKIRILIWVVFALFMASYLLIFEAGKANRRIAQGINQDPPENRARRDLANLQIALDMFREDCGRYPSSDESLNALVKNPGVKKWKGPYIIRLIKDPWKQPYFYALTNQAPLLLSRGADQLLGTQDDLEPLPYDPSAAQAGSTGEPPVVAIGPGTK